MSSNLFHHDESEEGKGGDFYLQKGKVFAPINVILSNLSKRIIHCIAGIFF